MVCLSYAISMQLRKLSYPGTEIYIVAYACNSEITLKNVEYKWVPEIQRNLESAVPQAWIILVGTKVNGEHGEHWRLICTMSGGFTNRG